MSLSRRLPDYKSYMSLILVEESWQGVLGPCYAVGGVVRAWLPDRAEGLYNFHENLDYGPIQCAQRVEQFVRVGGSNTVETQFWE